MGQQPTKRTTAARRPQTFDHVRSKKKPVIKKCWISGDSEVADDYQEQLFKVQRLRIMAGALTASESTKLELADAEDKLAVLETSYRATAIPFKFRSITRKQFEKLVNDHPVTEKTKAELESKGQDASGLFAEPETFSPAIVEACSYDPTITAQQYRDLSDDEDWSPAEVALLYETALAACTSTNRFTLGNG